MTRPRHALLGLALLIGALLAGCLPLAQETQKIHLSGFLENYSQLKYRKDRGGILTYTKPGVRWIEYRSLMIDTPEVFLSPAAGGIDRDAAKFQEMAEYFHARLLEAVKDAYPVVDEPGPDVLRVRTAITNVMTTDRARELRDDEDYIVPVDIGGASIEGEFLDSMSDHRLAAFVDSTSEARPGGVGIYARWDDAKLAFDGWATRFRQWLDYTHGVTLEMPR